MCQVSCHFPAFLHHFALAKLATTSTRVNKVCYICIPVILLREYRYQEVSTDRKHGVLCETVILVFIGELSLSTLR